MLRELEYPFDVDYINCKKKKIKRQLLSDDTSRIEKKIAILGGYTTHDIKLILELFLLNYGIKPIFYESEYNQYYQESVFPNEKLESFNPDIIYICTCNRNIVRYPTINDDAVKIQSMLDEEYNRWLLIWSHLKETYNCPIIQNNMEMPYYRLLGNRDSYDIHGLTNYISRLNMNFYDYASGNDNFFLCDINYISADYGLKEWSNPFYWHMYKYAVNVNAIPYLSFNIANIIKSLFGKNKKGIVLDLDNTLWGGVIGDDGVENIALGPEESVGQAYSEFQRYIKAQKQLGIILNIDSKNSEENAVAGLNHPDSVLKPDDFIDIKANWEPKDKNFREIAYDLDLLPESLVFIDDNPAERHIVREQLKNVSAPEIGEIHQYINIIDRNGFFEITSLSDDDKLRNKMYKENAERQKFETSFSDYTEYLISLDMKAEIRMFNPLYMARIAQLTNKSNQFNLTTKRYTQADIESKANDDSYITLYGKLIDRFGDNGVVSVVIGHIIENICHIDLWLMSCRVLKRNMEFAMMDTFIEECKDKGINKVIGYYYPTAKNSMVKEFYGMFGFIRTEEDETGNTKWELNTAMYLPQNHVIDVNNKNHE